MTINSYQVVISVLLWISIVWSETRAVDIKTLVGDECTDNGPRSALARLFSLFESPCWFVLDAARATLMLGGWVYEFGLCRVDQFHTSLKSRLLNPHVVPPAELLLQLMIQFHCSSTTAEALGLFFMPWLVELCSRRLNSQVLLFYSSFWNSQCQQWHRFWYFYFIALTSRL